MSPQPQPASRQRPKPTLGTLFQDARELFNDFRDRFREPAEDIVTTRGIIDIIGDVARPLIKYDWLAPARRIESQLDTIERRTARLETLATPLGSSAPARRESFAVTAMPTPDERFEVVVRGADLDDRPALVFTQNGRERRARILDSGGGAVRGEVALSELAPGPWDVFLEQGGRQVRLTTVELGGD